jgi:mono/diheme cytochrome c family protein
MRWRGTLVTTLVAALAGAPEGSAADPPGDVGNGLAIARTWCAQCHAVEAGETRQRADGLPSFVAIANSGRHTADSLRAFLTQPHGRMPDLNLSRQERDDLIAYLLSLREGRAAPVTPAPAPRRP